MPVYEYRCLGGHKSERICAVDNRDDVVFCLKCKGRSMRQMPKGTSSKWIGRILEWGKPDIIVDREEDLLVEGQKPMTVIEG